MKFKVINRKFSAKFSNSNSWFYKPVLYCIIIFSWILLLIRKKDMRVSSDVHSLALSTTGNQELIARIIGHAQVHVHMGRKLVEYISYLPLSKSSLSYAYFLIKERMNEDLRNNWKRLILSIFIISNVEKRLRKNGLIIIFNDHSVETRALTAWAKLNERDVMYIQHAPVNSMFLPLEYDHTVLFSSSALDVYLEKKLSSDTTSIMVACDFRLKKFYDLPPVENQFVLVCTNELDSVQRTQELIVTLVQSKYLVTLRPHPLDKRNWDIGFPISNESLYDDIQNHSIIICNETAVILEAIVAKRFVYKYLLSESRDHYGFMEKGLVEKEYTNGEDLLKAIKENEISYNVDRLSYFTGDIEYYNDYLKTIKETIDHYEKV